MNFLDARVVGSSIRVGGRGENQHGWGLNERAILERNCLLNTLILETMKESQGGHRGPRIDVNREFDIGCKWWRFEQGTGGTRAGGNLEKISLMELIA